MWIKKSVGVWYKFASATLLVYVFNKSQTLFGIPLTFYDKSRICIYGFVTPLWLSAQ